MNISLDQMEKAGPLAMPANAENAGMGANQSPAGMRPAAGDGPFAPCICSQRAIDFAMSSVVEISAAIDKLDVKEQVELLRILPQHLKISLDDSASTTSFECAATANGALAKRGHKNRHNLLGDSGK